MANITSTTQVDPAVDTYYDKVLLARARPPQIHNIAAQTRNVPGGSADILKLRRYSSLSTATTVLTEGVTPSGKALDKTDLTVQLEQYGDYITVTDKVTYIVSDPVLNEGVDILGQQMGETIDELTRDVLAGTASVDNADNGINGGTPTELTYADIQGVVKTLMGQSAKMFVPKIEGVAKFGTTPVRAAFWAMAHTDLLDDLEDIDEFVSVANYPDSKGISPAEWGSVGNTRWLLSPLGYLSSSIYSCFIVGRDAYGVSKIEKGVASSIFKPLGHGDDPLDQRSTQGWKIYYAARILNDNFMVNLKATHS